MGAYCVSHIENKQAYHAIKCILQKRTKEGKHFRPRLFFVCLI